MNGYYAHETSIVDPKAKIGDGTQIWQFCNIMHDSVIGMNCKIGQGVFVENGVKIGNGVKIKNNVSLYNGVICEDDVFLGPNCVFTNVLNPRSFIEKKTEFRNTLIKKGATVGANSTIICGNSIGKYALVGAGAVVTSDIPDHALVIGNPGRITGYVCKCGEKLDDSMKCTKCDKHYIIKDGTVTEEK